MSTKHRYGAFVFGLAIMMVWNVQLASCYGWKNDWELWDLEFNDERFEKEVSAWDASSLVNSSKKSYVCGSTYLMGGFNILGGTKNEYWERTFTDLPPHNQLNLSYIVYQIDSWDSTADDHYEIKVDDYNQIGWSFSAGSNGISQCGSDAWNEFPPVEAVSTFAHNASSVRIRFVNMLDQRSNDESLGIREVKMKFVNVTNPQNSLCGRSKVNVPMPKWPCTECDSSHQYISNPKSGTCFECAASCATCNAAGEKGCTSCFTGNYIDQKTCKQCDVSCATCINSANYCLTCQPDLFMVSNTCYPKCTYPLFVNEKEGINYCQSPCPKDQFAMWDSSCSSSCSGGLAATTMSSYQVCTFPCSLNPTA